MRPPTPPFSADHLLLFRRLSLCPEGYPSSWSGWFGCSSVLSDKLLGLALVITNLVAELTLLTALCHRTLITSDSTYYQQVQEATDLDSAWTRSHRIATGLEAGPTSIAPLRARGIAVLHLYRETLVFARPLMQTKHREIAEQILLVVQSAAEWLPFSEEEQRWLKNWM